MARRKREEGKERTSARPSRHAGHVPGSLSIAPGATQPVVHIFAYSPVDFIERETRNPEEVREFLGKWPVVWVNVDGLGDASAIKALGAIFGVHRMALEDVVNRHERAKLEAYSQHLLIVLRMMHMDEGLTSEQVSLFLGKDYVLTFQEAPNGDCFDPVRERIRQGKGRVRDAGADYLAYCLLDSIVDFNFPILEHYGYLLDEIEQKVVERPDTDLMIRIREVKRDLLTLRRAVWPLRDVVGTLLRDPSPFITVDTLVYLRDCHDHAVQNIDMIETYRELSSGLMDVFMSSISNRMNEIMKILTIFSTIFIPLTFITGLYGMNFNTGASPFNMPELNWYMGYPLVIALMLGVVVVMLLFFRRRGWVGGRGEKNGE